MSMTLVCAMCSVVRSKVLLVIVALSVAGAAGAQIATLPSQIESRYCYSTDNIPRNPDGTIKRSTSVRDRFRREHPCPSTGMTYGACPGWAIDHVIPLACGGCDSVSNMQWLPVTIKSGRDADNKDRWEQRVYCPR